MVGGLGLAWGMYECPCGLAFVCLSDHPVSFLAGFCSDL